MTTERTIGHHEKTPKTISSGSAKRTELSPPRWTQVTGLRLRTRPTTSPPGGRRSETTLTTQLQSWSRGPPGRPAAHTCKGLSAGVDGALRLRVRVGEELVDVGVLVGQDGLDDRVERL